MAISTNYCLTPELIFVSTSMLTTLKISEANYNNLSLGQLMWSNKSTSTLNLPCEYVWCVSVYARERKYMCKYAYSLTYLALYISQSSWQPCKFRFLGIHLRHLMKNWDPEIMTSSSFSATSHYFLQRSIIIQLTTDHKQPWAMHLSVMYPEQQEAW